MALVKATIKAAILSLENDAKAAPMTEDTHADRLADIIIDAILSADVKFPIAVTVNTGTGAGGTTELGELQ